jgi:hypothetical protein
MLVITAFRGQSPTRHSFPEFPVCMPCYDLCACLAVPTFETIGCGTHGLLVRCCQFVGPSVTAIVSQFCCALLGLCLCNFCVCLHVHFFWWFACCVTLRCLYCMLSENGGKPFRKHFWDSSASSEAATFACDQVMLFSALNDFITARSIVVYRFSHLFKFQYIVFDCVARWFARKVRHKTRVFSSPICMKVKSAPLMNAALLSDAWELFSFPKLAWINRFPVHSLPDIWPSCTPKQTWSLFRCLITYEVKTILLVLLM